VRRRNGAGPDQRGHTDEARMIDASRADLSSHTILPQAQPTSLAEWRDRIART
jgi:hypothetical protein